MPNFGWQDILAQFPRAAYNKGGLASPPLRLLFVFF